MTPHFSIIIPAYNRADFLPETIVSIQDQTFQDWECIVVDDGSTDNTAEVVSAMVAQDPRIKYVYQQNAERSAARNNGIKNAMGLYVCFLDSDDRYAHNYLQDLHTLTHEKGLPKAVIVSDFCIWNGSQATPVSTPAPDSEISTWLFKHPVSPSRVCVHSDILKSYRFREDIVIVEDTVLWVSIANEYPFIYHPKPLIWYRVHEDNSVNRATKACFSRYEGLRKFFSDPLSNIVPHSIKREMLSDTLWKMAEYNVAYGSKPQALRQIMHSLVLVPVHRHTKAKIYLLVFDLLFFGALK